MPLIDQLRSALATWLTGGSKNPKTSVGLCLVSSGASMAVRTADGNWRIDHIDATPASWPEAVVQLARRCELSRGAEVSLVLPAEAYQLLLVEPPEVADAEMRDAIRWRIRDLINMPIADCEVDVFPFPAEAQRGRALTFVAVARREDLQQRVRAVSSAKLQLRDIGIAELALRNWTEKAAKPTVALLQAAGNVGVISFIKAGNLYLSRRIDLRDAARAPEAALLQLQRSLDYFESQLGQGAVEAVVLSLPTELALSMRGFLAEMLPVPVVNWHEWVAACADDQIAGLASRSFDPTNVLAVGAAMERAA